MAWNKLTVNVYDFRRKVCRASTWYRPISETACLHFVPKNRSNIDTYRKEMLSLVIVFVVQKAHETVDMVCSKPIGAPVLWEWYELVPVASWVDDSTLGRRAAEIVQLPAAVHSSKFDQNQCCEWTPFLANTECQLIFDIYYANIDLAHRFLVCRPMKFSKLVAFALKFDLLMLTFVNAPYPPGQ